MSEPTLRRRLLDLLPTILLVTLLVFSGGFFVGRYGIPPKQPVIGGGGKTVDMSNFWEAKKLIEEKYPGEVDSQALIDGASRGLAQGLGDPYSAFLSSEEVKSLEQALSGEVEGIGVEVGVENGQVTVISPLPDTPAARGGLLAGDLILSVDGQPTVGAPLDDVVKKIRGPKGTTVTLEVRTGAAPARSVTMTRDTVRSPSVSLTYRDNVAVLDLSRYGDDTKNELDKAVADIQAKKPRGIILDLRGNPGGFLEKAIEVTSVFQKEGVVVKEQFKNNTTEQKAKADGRLADLPLVLLVNRGSASAAEITAGALRDNRGIKLVGEQTFGKGSVQELEPLRDGAVLKLTVAEWLTPKGASLSKQGLTPDIAIPSTNPEAQLQAALQALQ